MELRQPRGFSESWQAFNARCGGSCTCNRQNAGLPYKHKAECEVSLTYAAWKEHNRSVWERIKQIEIAKGLRDKNGLPVQKEDYSYVA